MSAPASTFTVSLSMTRTNGHPFLDGNGRVGRLPVTLLLCSAGALSQPLLYLSLYPKQHRSRYYDLLNRVRLTGDWEEWLLFFLKGVWVTAEGAVAASRRLAETFAVARAAIEAQAGRRAGSALRALEALKARPILSLPEVCNRTGLSFPTAASAMQTLAAGSIVRELTGRPRNRLFSYDRYLAILAEGTEAH